LLLRCAARLQREIAALDNIARGERRAREPARAAPYYDPGPAPPAREPRVAIHPTAEEIPAPVRTVEQQIAALGGVGERDLLAERRALFDPAPKPEPAKAPATPEYGGPALHVVETDSASAPEPGRPLPTMRKTTRPRSRARPGRNL
jgi:hypothetical protein